MQQLIKQMSNTKLYSAWVKELAMLAHLKTTAASRSG